MQEQTVARVNIEISADGKTECMFAEPVGEVAKDGSGLYRLLNTAFYSPFVLDDVVEVEARGRELLVVGLWEWSVWEAYDVRFAPHVTVAQMEELTRRWLEADGHVARCEDDVCVVTVLPGAGRGPSVHELDALSDEGLIKYAPVRDGGEDLSVWPPLP